MKNFGRLLMIVFLVVIAFQTTPALASPVLAEGGNTSRAVFGPIAPDPIWCPLGVTPLSGSGGCSPSFARLTALLTWLAAHDPDQAGVIWLAKTYNSAGEGVSGFTLDGAHFAHLDNHALTIQGGWNGLGTTTVDHTHHSLFTADFLRVDNWHAPVTVNDVLVDGAAATGISVNTTGNITLINVDSQNSVGGPGNGAGAWLMNYTGRGTLIVRDSTFNHNLETGLNALSSGAIWLNHVTANSNGANFAGADLDNRPSTSAQPVILLGSNTFNGNGTGLDVFSKGSIIVYGITADGNPGSGFGTGLYLDNTAAASPQPVSVQGAGHQFNDNDQAGLVVNSHGAITLQNLEAQRNGQWGTEVNNSGAGAAGSVILTGQNKFLNNGNSGMNAFSNGDISLFNAVTLFNASDGLLLSTPHHANVYCGKDYSNGGYGVNASTVTGPLTLSAIAFDGGPNLLGNYSYPGTPMITTDGCLLASGLASGGAPLHVVQHYTPGSPLMLNCSKFGGTQLVLPDGRQVTLDCPTFGRAIVSTGNLASLPGPLPKGDTFVSALKLSVKQAGIGQQLTGGLTVLSFMVPQKLIGQNFAIRYWDGKQWFDLGLANFQDGRVVFDGGSLTAPHVFTSRVNFTGLFALVSVP